MLDTVNDFLTKHENRDNIICSIIAAVVLGITCYVLRRLWSVTKSGSSRLYAYGKQEQERLNAMPPEERATVKLNEYDKMRRMLIGGLALLGWAGMLRMLGDWMMQSPTIMHQVVTAVTILGMSEVAAIMLYNARRHNHAQPRGRVLATITLLIFAIVAFSVFMTFYFPLMPYEPMYRF